MEKYGSIDALNEAWGTNFWNQTYNSFEEVYVPRTTLSNNTNPHEVLDYTRFVSDSACKFAKLQSDIIRKYIKPGDFITFGNGFCVQLFCLRKNPKPEAAVASSVTGKIVFFAFWVCLSK